MCASLSNSSGRPLEGEFASYAAGDIAFVAGNDAVDALVQQGKAVTNLLNDHVRVLQEKYLPLLGSDRAMGI